MQRRSRQRLQSVVALLSLLVLTVGVPVVLVRIAGWPLPHKVPDWSRVKVAITQGDIPGETVIKALAVVVWLIWLQVVWAIVWEVVVNVPRMSAGRRPRSAPLVVAPVCNGVGRLVALVMAFGITVASIPSSAVALPGLLPTRFAVSAPVAAASVSVAKSPADFVVAPAPTWRVAQHDSLWHIAEVALGEGDRSSEILELNSWLRSPRDVKAGQVLRMPADSAVPDDRRPQPAAAEPAQTAASDNGPATYLAPMQIVIKRGDTLWDLSEDRLSQVDVHVTPPEILDEVKQVIAANPNVIEDPNLIFPGEVFAFPAVGTPPPPPEPDVVVDTVSEPVAAVTHELPPPVAAAVQPAESAPPAPVPATATAVAAPSPSAPSQPPIEIDAGTSTGVESGPIVPWIAGISGATVLASGLLLAYRRRLALRASRGARAYRLSTPTDPSTLRAITRAADVSLLHWANHELAQLFAVMRPRDVDGMPLAIELSESHGIELLWTAANPIAPHPWEATDGGWSWRLLYDPDLPLPHGEQPAVLPALVTIGTRDGNQLLLNLEAVGSLAVAADDDTAESFIRSLIVELAAGELLTDTYVHCAGIPLDGTNHFARIHTCDEPTALTALQRTADASSQFLEEHGMKTAFESRLGGDALGRESTVVAVRPSDESGGARFTSAVRAGVDACVVIAGPVMGAASRVTIEDDGDACLQPIGLRFEPALLPLTTMESITELLDEVSEPLDDEDESLEPSDEPAAATLTLVEPTGDLGEDDEWNVPEPNVLVRVMGVPEVVGYPQLGRIETSIVTYLACHGGKRTDDQIINAVWNGRLVEPKTLWNKISKIRSALGVDLVPPRSPNSTSVILSAGISTDVVVLRALYERASQVSTGEAVRLLLHGLAMVEGVPFDAPSYDWAFESQSHADACELIESVALRCSTTALDLGDVASAREAVKQALRALPLNEPLYRERMRIESAAGNPDGVQKARSALDDVTFDGWVGKRRYELSPPTLKLASEFAHGE